MNDITRKNTILSALTNSGIVAIAFIAVATIAGELYAPFKNFLAETFSHHWIGKGVIAMAIFFIGGVLLAALFPRQRLQPQLLWVLFWVSLLATCAIVGFYVYEVFFVHS